MQHAHCVAGVRSTTTRTFNHRWLIRRYRPVGGLDRDGWDDKERVREGCVGRKRMMGGRISLVATACIFKAITYVNFRSAFKVKAKTTHDRVKWDVHRRNAGTDVKRICTYTCRSHKINYRLLPTDNAISAPTNTVRNPCSRLRILFAVRSYNRYCVILLRTRERTHFRIPARRALRSGHYKTDSDSNSNYCISYVIGLG